MWVLLEMLQYQCDTNQFPIGIVPFGTGNDFARVLGWGGNISNNFIGENLNGLKRLIKKWISSKISLFDIWEVEFQTQDNGYFEKIEYVNEKATKIKMLDKNGQIIKSIKKPMSNYFSIGIDARIGFGFDKNRTQSAFINKAIYCCEAFKKLFIKTNRINQVLESLEILNEKQGLEKQLLKNEEQEQSNYYLKCDPACLLILNIDSYAGGVSNIWKSGRNKIGVQQLDKSQINQTQFKEQSYGDGIVEFISFDSSLNLGYERLFNGNAKKIAQGFGPFLLNFKKIESDLITFFQIDGEYYSVNRPKQVILKKFDQLFNGQIKVLVNQE
ncbi:hypothetical protein IMG5_064480 [Ichthyophthirius multifiliis]|uniref:diacylglycerol kinase (ATP) n=1 Tax=Ichthyophthirius multifiliis TaxID=5932 RepID=G0QP63_ICHMU|nr:hypothetical protein IMG5_064480 [Ichthyophthirius multifiliis]EGR32993.1 hypothetical protein IMG5_064480 [Ichthyophthirius multifiliis]|eukprot:XP_004036979.1 hypothetical protein IMG5_064480 [Ichthyophthirius multifiliis]